MNSRGVSEARKQYEKFKKLMEAWLDGVPIERYREERNVWSHCEPLGGLVTLDSVDEFRVKPEEPKNKMVPFETIEDVIPYLGRKIKSKTDRRVSIVIGARYVEGHLYIDIGTTFTQCGTELFENWEFIAEHTLFPNTNGDYKTIGKLKEKVNKDENE